MRFVVPVTVFSLAIFLCSAGCLTSAGAGGNPEHSAKEFRYNFSAIAVQTYDVPYNVTMIESRQKQESEVSDLALNLGWEGGYIVRLEKTKSPDEQPADISQSIAIYPEERMQDIAQYVIQTEKRNSTYSFIDLPDPGLGDSGTAFAAYKTNQTSVAGLPSTEPEYYEIIFSKDTIFEVVRISGPSAD